jgi:uncharacterized protein (DUF302 family)
MWNFCRYLLLSILFLLASCAAQPGKTAQLQSAIYEVAVAAGVGRDDVLLSLKSLSEGMNFVNPAHFPIGEHLKERGVTPQGALEVHAYCNLSMGADIMLDHPEFVVFAPCRIGLYERGGRLYLGLARPTHDLRSIAQPTPRAQKAAQMLEDTLIDIVNKAAQGEF